MKTNEIIKKRRNQLGLTLLEVAKKLDVSEATIQRYESGHIKNLKYDRITNLSEILECTPEYLMGFSDRPNEIFVSEPPTSYIANHKKMKVYGKICAGNGKLAYEDILDEIICPYPHAKGEMIALQVDGESMNKIIPNGVYAILKLQPSVENGQVAAVIIDGENAMLKRFYKVDGETVMLKPETTDLNFKARTFMGDEINKLKIIGKYIGFVSPSVE